MNRKCPRCNIATQGASAPASVIAKMVDYMPPDICRDEIVFYAICPNCMVVILPAEFNPGK